MKRTIYRDSETGRFASKSTWTRSHAQGGHRYKRQTIPITKEPEKAPVRPEPEELELEEFIDEYEDEPEEEITGGFDYGKNR